MLNFVMYVGCFQDTGMYCIGYHNYCSVFQFYVYFVHVYILNVCSFLYLNFTLNSIISRPSTFICYCTKKCLHFYHLTLLTPCQICTKLANLVLCDITLVGFPENSPLFQCDIVNT